MKGRLTTGGGHALLLAVAVLACLFGVFAAGSTTVRLHAPVLVFAKECPGVEKAVGGEELLSPQWLYYQSRAEEFNGREIKQQMDCLVNQWTKKRITQKQAKQMMKAYLRKNGYEIQKIRLQEQAFCVFPSPNDLPDYTKTLVNGKKTYQFIGVYTDGERDSMGRLLCYYWEAGVR